MEKSLRSQLFSFLARRHLRKNPDQKGDEKRDNSWKKMSYFIKLRVCLHREIAQSAYACDNESSQICSILIGNAVRSLQIDNIVN